MFVIKARALCTLVFVCQPQGMFIYVTHGLCDISFVILFSCQPDDTFSTPGYDLKVTPEFQAHVARKLGMMLDRYAYTALLPES